MQNIVELPRGGGLQYARGVLDVVAKEALWKFSPCEVAS